MARRETVRETAGETRLVALGLLAFCAGVIVLMLALLHMVHLQSSPQGDKDTVKGQLMAVPAVVALVTGIVALSGRRRDWALTVGRIGAAAGVVAVLLTVLLPGGA